MTSATNRPVVLVQSENSNTKISINYNVTMIRCASCHIYSKTCLSAQPLQPPHEERNSRYRGNPLRLIPLQETPIDQLPEGNEFCPGFPHMTTTNEIRQQTFFFTLSTSDGFSFFLQKKRTNGFYDSTLSCFCFFPFSLYIFPSFQQGYSQWPF